MDQKQSRMSVGLLAGASTGIFWGLPFLVPQLLKHYSASDIAFGRFFFFGVVSLFFLPQVVRILRSLGRKDLLKIVLLSASGFWFYSDLLFWAIQKTDGVIASLVLGLLPISIPLFTPGKRKGGTLFYLGLFLILVGLLSLFCFPVLTGMRQVRNPAPLGVFALLVCLALWTGFAISNSRFLQSHPDIPKKDFSSVMGVLSMLFMTPIFLSGVSLLEFMGRGEFPLFLLCSIGLGFGSSWLANWLWNISSFYCPSEISGTLLVFETIFGLLYSFGFEHRLPYGFEFFSIILFLGGVLLSVTAQMKASQ